MNTVFTRSSLSINRGFKAIISIDLIFTSIALILLQENPANGYEISIYGGFSSLIWTILIISSVGSLGAITLQAFFTPRSGLWKIAFMNLLLNGFITIAFHALRGYYRYTGIDQQYHLTVIQGLIRTGDLGESNFYPLGHILGATGSIISNVDPYCFFQYFPPFFSIFFLMIITYLLAKQTMRSKGEILIAAAAAYIFFFNGLHPQFYPQTFSVFILVFAIYVYITALNTGQSRYALLLIIVLVSLPFSHPTSSVICILSLLSMECARFYLFKDHLNLRKGRRYYIPILLSSAVLVGWVSYFRLFSEKVVHLKTIFIDDRYSNIQLATTTEIADKLSLAESAQYAIRMYGENMVYLGLTTVCILVFFYAIRYKKEVVHQYRYLFLLLFATIACVPVFLFLVLGIGSVTMGRALHLMYPILFTPLFVSFVIRYFQKKYNCKGAVILIIIIFFAIMSTLSTLSVYHSPWTYSASWQVTKMDATGADWLIETKQSNNPCVILGVEVLGLPRLTSPPTSISTGVSSIGSQGSSNRIYLLVNKKFQDICADPDAQKSTLTPFKAWEFDKHGNLKITSNPGTLEIYSNGEMNVWLV
jgi:hypothetical protein